MAKRDYYDVLGVEKGASSDAIRKAFKKQAMEHHPDRNRHDPKSEARFKEVNEAYDVLKDDQKKAAYDRFGHAAFENGHGASAGAGGFRPGGADFSSAFSDIFEDLFGMGAAAQRTRSRSQRGSDLRYNLSMTLEEAFHGKQATISVPSSAVCDVCDGTGAEGGAVPATCPTCSGMGKVRAQQGFFTVERTCPTCAGRGQIIKNPCASCNGAGRVARERTLNVNIPAGVETGTRIRLASEGEAGLRGGPAGDLYIFVEVERHPIFERENQDLYCRIPLAMTTATLGGEIDAPTLDGGKTRVKVPSGVQSGKQLRLRGKGMPPLRGTGAGDLYIELAVETPVNLTARQKELLREFEQESRENSPEAQDFFSRVKGFWDGMKG
ncbi:molecular chaperone DnaJ [Amaricoccus macauensis]|uniref:Chaperone protein DnaJ n=1 Tax=Amaricoccus macauensis TaxID=57001 RepID=A0A840SNU3_9RHOB|nr:molecular chaperone DnaJ [Amaricoccus macauensis]MBB5220972.1 molecular chaperone DnaJ [Amaricoccus macauensis]